MFIHYEISFEKNIKKLKLTIKISNITTSIEEVEKLKCWYCAFLRYLIPLMALFLIVLGTITNYWSSVVCFKLQRTQPTSAFTILGFMFLVCFMFVVRYISS
jgi:hypothetical protein